MVRKAVMAFGLLAGVVGLGAAVFTMDFESGGKPVAPAADRVLDGVSSTDSAQLRQFYAAMADIVVRDGKSKDPIIRTVFDLRNRHKHALSMAFESSAMVGKYAGLGERLDKYLLNAVGEVDLPLTTELRQSAAQAFTSIR